MLESGEELETAPQESSVGIERLDLGRRSWGMDPPPWLDSEIDSTARLVWPVYPHNPYADAPEKGLGTLWARSGCRSGENRSRTASCAPVSRRLPSPSPRTEPRRSCTSRVQQIQVLIGRVDLLAPADDLEPVCSSATLYTAWVPS